MNGDRIPLIKPLVLSLFDYTGNWAKPFVKYGYNVLTVDIKQPLIAYMYEGRKHIQGDILDMEFRGLRPSIILAAPPCTDFALAGARHFATKDADGRTAKSIELVQKTLEIIRLHQPKVWVIENPATRMHKLVPELGKPRLKFQPWEYGGYVSPPETRCKQTWLWGEFTIPPKRPVEPDVRNANGMTKWYNAVGGKSEKTKEWRSATLMGFTEAFAEYNYVEKTP